MVSSVPNSNEESILWYDKPAESPYQALPVGNGHFGGMLFGGVYRERVILNEDTLWSGYPRRTGVDNAAERYLPELRRLILKEADYYRAEEIADKMQGPFNESYLPLGSLTVDLTHRGTAKEYIRQLDLRRGVCSVAYTIEGVRYSRTLLASVPDQVMALHFRADHPGMISFRGCLSGYLRHETAGFASRYAISGRCPRHVDPEYLESSNKVTDHPIVYDEAWEKTKGMRFECHVQIDSEGGVFRSSPDGFSVSGADQVMLLLWAGTSYRGFDQDPSDNDVDIEGMAGRVLARASLQPLGRLLENHVSEHSDMYDRVAFSLPSPAEARALPTDARRERYVSGNEDPGLVALFFRYGRYLLMASSRPGTQPANLQGIWNWDMRPVWSSNYTLNINAQMNYWPAEVANLSECHQPFLDFLKDLTVTGSETARNLYASGGWVAHHNVDIWRATAPIGRGESDCRWALWPMGGVYVCQHLWEHYLYTEDLAFLENHGYPVLRGAARFILDFLVDDGNGTLTTCPSTVPENRYRLADGSSFSVGAGSTMDYMLITDLFHCVKEAAAILDRDTDLCSEIEAAESRLPNIFPTDGEGLIQAWQHGTAGAIDEESPYGQLYALFPGRLLSPRRTPELARAAAKALDRNSHKRLLLFANSIDAAMWARLEDGDKAYDALKYLVGPVTFDNLLGRNGPDFFR